MYMYTDKYTVQSGDTLTSIARKFELLNYSQILRVNRDIINPDLIYPGQVINIPKMTPMTTYVIKANDILWRIVSNYNIDHVQIYGKPITIDEVLAYNPMIINPNFIYPGMILYLPKIL